jgi:hypothetical protein
MIKPGSLLPSNFFGGSVSLKQPECYSKLYNEGQKVNMSLSSKYAVPKSENTSFFLYLLKAQCKSVLRIRDVYPGSRIPDPKTARKERGEKKLYVTPLLIGNVSTNRQRGDKMFLLIIIAPIYWRFLFTF